MEWVNTTADTVEAATDEALELLGVTVDEVELEDEPISLPKISHVPVPATTET